MIKINILTKGFVSANSYSFLGPLINFKKTFSDLGVKISFFFSANDNFYDCDYLIFDSKFFKYSWGKKELKKTKRFFINSKKKTNRLIFFDLSDSSSFIIADALELSDVYLKNQILKNKKLYLKKFYGRRIFSDYYNKKFGVLDPEPEKFKNPNKNNLKKIKVAWNSCFSNYSFFGNYLMKLFQYTGNPLFLKYPKIRRNYKRKEELSCRMNIEYSKKSISFQRQKISELLKQNYSFDKVSRIRYFSELKRSKVVISPFGYGEINLKDFEAFLYGCVLFKPCMQHLETWPNLYLKNKTYVSFKWDFSDLIFKLNAILENFDSYRKYAENAQILYDKILHSDNFSELFCQRFLKIIRN